MQNFNDKTTQRDLGFYSPNCARLSLNEGCTTNSTRVFLLSLAGHYFPVEVTMNNSFLYENTYVLDKKHFNECYTQSVNEQLSIKSFSKAIFLSCFGLSLLLFTKADAYIAWFLAALGILDAASVYYRKAWWLARQMISKAAGNELTLTIDEQGIKNHSPYVDNLILWSEITNIEPTALGLLIKHKNGVNYLSNSVLSEDASQYILHR